MEDQTSHPHAQSLLAPGLRVRGQMSNVVVELSDTEYSVLMAMVAGNLSGEGHSVGTQEATDMPVDDINGIFVCVCVCGYACVQ